MSTTAFFPFHAELPCIRYVGQSTLEPGDSYSSKHIGFEIVYIIAGTGTFTQGRNPALRVSKGEIFVIQAQRNFTIEARTGRSPLTLRYIGLDRTMRPGKGKSELLPLLESAFALKGKRGKSYRTEELGRLMTDLCNHVLAGSQVGSHVLAWGLCLQWLAGLAELSKTQNIEHMTERVGDRAHQAVQDAIRVMENSFGEKWRVAMLAERVHLSPYYFARVFKTLAGCSPMQYLNRLRIEKAKALLADDLKLAVIAEHVGFNDAAYLSTAFKRVEGISPQTYKRRLRESGIHYP